MTGSEVVSVVGSGATLLFWVIVWFCRETILANIGKKVSVQLADHQDKLSRGQKIHELQFHYEFEAYRKLWCLMQLIGRNVAGTLLEVRKIEPNGKAGEEFHSIYGELCKSCQDYKVALDEYGPFIDSDIWSKFYDVYHNSMVFIIYSKKQSDKRDEETFDKLMKVLRQFIEFNDKFDTISNNIKRRIRLEVRPADPTSSLSA